MWRSSKEYHKILGFPRAKLIYTRFEMIFDARRPEEKSNLINEHIFWFLLCNSTLIVAMAVKIARA